MTERRESSEPRRLSEEMARQPLRRERILQVGLRLIDQQGLDSLSMRKLAQELKVDPMALYRHFKNKEALLDGVAELLWKKVELPENEAGWEPLLRSVATSLYALAHIHPHAYSLLLNRQILPLTMLQLSDTLRERLQRDGFERQRASEVICALFSYAIGYAMVEVSTLLPQPSENAGGESMTEIARLTQLMQRLPRETPAHTVEAAYALTNYEADAQFTFGLDLMLTGLKYKSG
ncbi:TetR/AcrR family transcriptional regulator [Ktedonosporobacter rubrisoli]|uniref:TetR/AcrR family transcriptional regulator n=1 Tax=Ktedonosporobacter rubrisoli TaxID=2509675 RepID=A0A4P6JLX1_KTERU|nr:TetR family transcriptional regulator [Ktedonosporobacter rubrisoli]QBD76267.1 TetR/AcrR family transcriptional regulator [Ktedonosporobacter rubrisoli]